MTLPPDPLLGCETCGVDVKRMRKNIESANKGVPVGFKEVQEERERRDPPLSESTVAAYRHVETLAKNTDTPPDGMSGGFSPWWHGWAVRDAFVAGAKWQEDRQSAVLKAAVEWEAAKADFERLPYPGIVTRSLFSAESALRAAVQEMEDNNAAK